MGIKYLKTNDLTSKQIQDLAKLEKHLFPTTPQEQSVDLKLVMKKNLHCLLVYNDSDLVACKIGYPLDENQFYSWYGGVHPNYRGQGIAKKLMLKQHNELVEQKFKTVLTKTRASYSAMVILNLKLGFIIKDCELRSSKKELTLILEKSL